MEDTASRAIAIVGAGAILPDAPNVASFWENLKTGRYSITEVSPDRWDPALYYDADPAAPDKTYSKIGGWVRDHEWDPLKWHLPIPPRVADAMDGGQKWAIACTRQALEDYGYPKRPLDLDRTGVILGNAMAGEKHYRSSLRIFFPEYDRELSGTTTFAALPEKVRRAITSEFHERMGRLLPEVTEDTMPGELANCTAGRIANVFNMRGPNFVTDAACASAMAAISAAVEGLAEHHYDAVITGGVDRNMGAPSFVKFCKIGALSPTGSRPYGAGADGFVMGEGAALFLMKRLADAERDGDRIYAVLRGMGASSDGKGKGITAPNPVGQKLALQRAWQNAGLSPGTVGLMEGHGTSTRVGDVVEVQSMSEVLGGANVRPGSVALGSVKSNIGHLKGAAGAAGILKVALALRDKVLPPSLHCERRNPDIDFSQCPLKPNTELQPWAEPAGGVRRAGVSAFGFGGTNFHAVLEEYIPHRLTVNGKRSVAVSVAPPVGGGSSGNAPLRGALVIGSASERALAEPLLLARQAAEAGRTPARALPSREALTAPERIAIDYSDAADLAQKCAKALKAIESNQPAMWKALRAQGIFRGHGVAPKVAFLYTGQGSQYANMLAGLRAASPIVAETFAEADRVMTPILGKPLSQFVYVDAADSKAVAKAEEDLRQTAITQPAVLATDLSLTRLLASYGICPDMTMGHSLGEYGALVASGGLPFEDALEAVAARGREMTRVSMADNGKMAAVFAPLATIEETLKSIDGYVVIANINSNSQAVIGGASKAVENAVAAFLKAGFNAIPLPVSHAFHTSIVAPASTPLREVLTRLHLTPPRVPVVSNVNGEFYPQTTPEMIENLAQQIYSPVQFVKGLRTLYEAGARVFVEVGPKKALQGCAEDVLGDREDVVTLFTNHPKTEDLTAFNQALCAMYAAGLGVVEQPTVNEPKPERSQPQPAGFSPVGITGAALGLPGKTRVFDDSNIASILRGEPCIDVIPVRFRRAMLEKNITRVVKNENGGSFETIKSAADVIKLAGRGGELDLEKEFGIPADRLPALDRVTALAMGVGIDALRDAGIPLVMRYKTTTKGTRLQDRWELPVGMRDDTGVIFASAFPGFNSFADEAKRYYGDQARRDQLSSLEAVRAKTAGSEALQELDRRIGELRSEIERNPYTFDRRFIFRILPMGHSQFAEYIGARGPNTHVNAACASTTHAVSVAEDWIRAGRCRRVIIVSADDITSDHLIEWLGAAFLASGAAATDEIVEEAAVPFDRRRHGMIMGMGAAALVVESAEAARERGIQPICEVLSAVTANSAFHGTRLDPEHIAMVMENLVSQAETRTGIKRDEIASRTVLVSHETYTPARGGSASAEIHSLRRVFGTAADRIIIANTKGFTGHAMATGVEDVIAVKALETGCVPPVANFKEVDPELGPLNLSKGGAYPVEYAMRLGAGFGSQISMSLLRWVTAKNGQRVAPHALGYANRIVDQEAWKAWLSRMAGHASPDLEIVQRTLRVRNAAAVPRPIEAPAAIAAPVPAPAPKAPPLPAVPVAAKPAPAPAPPPAASNPVKERILAIVAGKTGYPSDMLELDLDLEADLGVDTVKQAEVFAAIRETYDIPRDPNLKLRDFPTLAHVIQFVYDRRPDLAQAPAPKPAPLPEPAVTAPAAASNPVKERILAIVAGKTGYPSDMLELDLDLEADLGVDTVKQAEVFAAIRETYDIPRDPNLKLRDFPTLAHVIQFVYDRRPDLAQAPAAKPAPLPEPAVTAPAADEVREKVLSVVAQKTGYPAEMLELDLDLEADLGVDTVKQAEVFAAIRETYSIPRDTNLKLRDFPTLAHVIQFVYDRRPDLAQAPAARPAPAPPAKPEAAPEPAPTAAAPSAAPDAIRDKVLAIMAEKTGYPVDMLDPDLDLEADLGIDTVKQAEMFASVRAAFDIPRDQNLKLRDFPTLGHVIEFARQRASGPVAAETATASPARPAAAGFDAANRIPRRIPVPRLRPPLDLCKATAVNLSAGRRVLVVPDSGGVAEALTERLRSAGVEVVAPQAIGEVQGVYWLPALDDEGDLRNLDPEAWRSAIQTRVKSLYGTMRGLYEQIARPETFLVSATRLGGLHGYNEAGATSPLGGAVTGFTKTYKRERPDALVKAVDFSGAHTQQEIAGRLIEETLRDPGAVEIGYYEGARWTIGIEERAVEGAGMTLDRDTVFVVTGAAGSIVSAITADLAAASGGTFYLLDLVPEPPAGDADLARFNTDRDGLKRDLYARMQARGERATPALVEKELQALERAHAARSAIDAVQAAGGTAHYFAVNLTDSEAVAKVIASVRERSGRVDVLLHAAGMERSRFLPDKDPREFNLVFDVKSDGWFNLLHAIGDMPLGAVVAFTSIAGRFGNGGQADYSSANDLLAKTVSSFRTTRPGMRALAIDWSAWAGIGMASRGSIPKMMEMAGIDMLPPEAGIPWIRRELTEGAMNGEVVVGNRLGVLLEEWDATRGLETAVVPFHAPMFGKFADDLSVETTLDPTAQPFLYDHQIEGKPVLPGVMGIEAFAEAALALLPGWHIDAIEDVNFLAPVKFYRNEPRTLRIETVYCPAEGGVVADCRLIASRILPNQAEPQLTTHFTARVRLTQAAPARPVAAPPPVPEGASVAAADIYRVYFHGPAYQVVERAWRNGQMIARMSRALPANHQPAELSTASAPRVIEFCFQTAGLWEMLEHERFGLPLHIDSVRLFHMPDAEAELYCVATPSTDGSFHADVLDAAGNRYLELTGYRTVAIPGGLAAEQLAVLRGAVHEELALASGDD